MATQPGTLSTLALARPPLPRALSIRPVRCNSATDVAGIPIAAGALYPAFQLQLPPAVAGFFMAMSSVSVCHVVMEHGLSARVSC